MIEIAARPTVSLTVSCGLARCSADPSTPAARPKIVNKDATINAETAETAEGQYLSACSASAELKVVTRAATIFILGKGCLLSRILSRDFTMNKDAARLVLVVEDDVSVRRPLVKFLEMHGFSVVTAETADEGLDALRKNRVVAAVVDLRLRRGSGRDVVVSTPADVPVIIFSGVPSESAELERLRARTRLIEKPYSLVLLVETLEEMLSETSQNLHP
jgi:CheY-like chemotaxis protein